MPEHDWELECDADHESHNQDGLNIWDFNIRELIGNWLNGNQQDEVGQDFMNQWLGSQMNAANVNFAPQNTNVQNFININTQLAADVNFSVRSNIFTQNG